MPTRKRPSQMTVGIFSFSKKNLISFFTDEVMEMYKKVIIPMEYRGVPLDLELMQKTKAEIEQDIKLLENKILPMIEPDLKLF